MEITCLVFVLVTLSSTGMGDRSDEFICKRITNDMKDLDTNFTGDNYHVDEKDGNSMTETKSVILKTYAQDCLELYDKGEKRDGIYKVSPDDGCPIRVYCDMTNGGWTVMQRRKDGSVSFKRTWAEYVEGFGDLEGDFWLGLNHIHRLTKDGSQIYINL
ncbi:hypothetical protein ACJMK2_039677 [Sinanodonta woodiana]|uniref:Fibrinogen C-terminal domain-containing protein n=1 Tax=Sinanodonta woodiana TaxID=1069815 RepID=A0ABD3WG53_SINWO